MSFKLSSWRQQSGGGRQTMITRAGSFNSRKSSASRHGSDSDTGQPQITTVSTADVTSSDGDLTRVTIRGRHLGVSKDDISVLSVCGATCLPTLIYHSSQQLVCTTNRWKGNNGLVVIETKSGGRASTSVTLMSNSPVHNGNPQRKESLTRSSDHEGNEQEHKKIKVQSEQDLANAVKDNAELRAQVQMLQQDNKRLQDKNDTLKLYIDHLVARVMEECPEALCGGTTSAAGTLAMQ